MIGAPIKPREYLDRMRMNAFDPRQVILDGAVPTSRSLDFLPHRLNPMRMVNVDDQVAVWQAIARKDETQMRLQNRMILLQQAGMYPNLDSEGKPEPPPSLPKWAEQDEYVRMSDAAFGTTAHDNAFLQTLSVKNGAEVGRYLIPDQKPPPPEPPGMPYKETRVGKKLAKFLEEKYPGIVGMEIEIGPEKPGDPPIKYKYPLEDWSPVLDKEGNVVGANLKEPDPDTEDGRAEIKRRKQRGYIDPIEYYHAKQVAHHEGREELDRNFRGDPIAVIQVDADEDTGVVKTYSVGGSTDAGSLQEEGRQAYQGGPLGLGNPFSSGGIYDHTPQFAHHEHQGVEAGPVGPVAATAIAAPPIAPTTQPWYQAAGGREDNLWNRSGANLIGNMDYAFGGGGTTWQQVHYPP